MCEVLLQRLAQLAAVGGAEVDLVFRAIEPEADGAGRLAAVEVINEQRLNSLSHEMILIPSGEGKRAAGPRLTSCRPAMPARASAILRSAMSSPPRSEGEVSDHPRARPIRVRTSPGSALSDSRPSARRVCQAEMPFPDIDA